MSMYKNFIIAKELTWTALIFLIGGLIFTRLNVPWTEVWCWSIIAFIGYCLLLFAPKKSELEKEQELLEEAARSAEKDPKEKKIESAVILNFLGTWGIAILLTAFVIVMIYSMFYLCVGVFL